MSRQYGTQQFIRQERTEICKESQTVWTKGTIYPSPGSQILRVPFQFNLPVELHPSFEYNAAYKNAIIGYFIEVVGARKGTFNANRRIIRPFAVVRDDPEGASIRSALQKGWSQEWTTTERFAKIRKGLWGGHADVRMEVKYAQEIKLGFVRMTDGYLLVLIAKGGRSSALHQDSVQTSSGDHDERDEVHYQR